MNSPYIRTKATVSGIRRDALIALVPVIAGAVLINGTAAAFMLILALAGACAADILFDLALRRRLSITELEAPLIGILIGLCMPKGAAVWIAPIGGAAAVLVFKQLIGLAGRSYIDPAAAAYCLLLLIFRSGMTAFSADAVSGATQLAVIRNSMPTTLPLMHEVLSGAKAGCIGEIPIAILIGLVYLLIRRVISAHITLAYVLSFALLTAFFGFNSSDMTAGTFTLYQVLSGGLLFGAVFIAPRYASSPVSAAGRVIFGTGCGIITFILRRTGALGAFCEGTMISILCMNLLSPIIERLSYRRRK